LSVIQGEDEIGRLDLTPDPRILEVLGKIPYKSWQCLAELVDNSFDELLSDPDRDPHEPAAIHITVPKASASASASDALVGVSDEGRGMSRETLEKSLRAGYTGKAGFGTLGLFGMGFNISTARLGNRTEVRTSRAGDEYWLVAEIDLREMQRRGGFRVPVRRSPKDDPSERGTQIVVRDLNPDMLDTLRRPNTINSVRQRLGRVYSYLLRGVVAIPGVPAATLSGRGISLYLNGKRIEPWIPCVWSESRAVSYKGAEISAVQPVVHDLTDAWACARCGYWQHQFNSGRCASCDSEDLERRQRRVRGWLGVQRYLHDSQYGIDFIRNGRAILTDETDLFTWQDPDTGDKFPEYPVDVPATQGRLVGEIHLDHVPVDYQKTDFKRETPEWLEAVTHLRGEGPMREKKAKDRGYPDNRSPLGLLFKAFQENRPGLRCLIPGDGEHATHDKARQWGALFHKGLPEYQSDEKWYEAAAQHDAIRNQGRTGGDRGTAPGALGGRTGLTPLPPGPPSPPPVGGQRPPAPPAVGETEDERFDRYRKEARELYDLAGEVTVAGIGKRQVRVFETSAELSNSMGDKVPVVSRAGTGMNLEVYVNGEHRVFREYGRDPRDYAIIEIAQTLRALAHSDIPVTAVAADVTSQFPDQRMTPSALRDRAEAVLGRIRDLIAPAVAARAADMWAALPQARKNAAEREATRVNPNLDWREATRDGGFTAYLDCAAIALLVTEDPGAFLDGAVFTVTWTGWSDAEARSRQVSQVVRLLETTGEFLADRGAKNRQELAMIRLTADMLDQIVARQE
jgi:histidine kinase/DNA gyrase B/HSP90-like ATPase